MPPASNIARMQPDTVVLLSVPMAPKRPSKMAVPARQLAAVGRPETPKSAHQRIMGGQNQDAPGVVCTILTTRDSPPPTVEAAATFQSVTRRRSAGRQGMTRVYVFVP